MKRAEMDEMIKKGLISYLNWQDKQPERLKTPRPETPPADKQQQSRIAVKLASPVRGSNSLANQAMPK